MRGDTSAEALSKPRETTLTNVSMLTGDAVVEPARNLLTGYSVEVLARDHKGIAAAARLLGPGSEVFVPSLPHDTLEDLVTACTALHHAGLAPVPHISARIIRSRAVLADMLKQLTLKARVESALVIGGDVDAALGEFDAATQLIETGLFEANGINRIALAVHPEGHPRVADELIWPALTVKLDAAASRGIETYLVSQFAFDAAPYITIARRLRAHGITQRLRAGVAGPASRMTLIRYAMMCGVGASLRTLRERHGMASNMAAGETPEALIRELAAAQALEPSLGIDSVHFFTFGSLEGSVGVAASLAKSLPE